MIFLLFGTVAVLFPVSTYAISLDDDEEDAEDVSSYLDKAKQSAKKENFSTANSFLKKAKAFALLGNKVKETERYIEAKEKARDERLERERLAKLEKERQEKEEQERLARLERESQQAQTYQSSSSTSSSSSDSSFGDSLHINVQNGAWISTTVKKFTIKLEGDSSTGYVKREDSSGNLLFQSGYADFTYMNKGSYSLTAEGINNLGNKVFSLSGNINYYGGMVYCTIDVKDSTIRCKTVD